MSRETEYTSVLDKIIIEEEIKFSEWAVEGGEQVWSTTFVIQYLIKFGDKQSLGAYGDERRWT